MLRVVVTPHHTDTMKKQFVQALQSVWQELGISFKEPVPPHIACSKFAKEYGEWNDYTESPYLAQPVAIKA